jgi:hypothetical protein
MWKSNTLDSYCKQTLRDNANFKDNCNKGSIPESLINKIVNKYLPVKDHETWQSGLDVETLDSSLAFEVINWHGGFINPIRFDKIINNLITLGSHAKYRIFVCAGVKPTKEQRMLLKAYGLKLILLPAMRKKIDEWKPLIIKALLKEGVITNILSITLLDDKTIQLPFTVLISDDIQGTNPHEVWAWNIQQEMKIAYDKGIGWIE